MEKIGKAGAGLLIVLFLLAIAQGLTIHRIGFGPLTVDFESSSNSGNATTTPGPQPTTHGPVRPVVPQLAGQTKQAAGQALAAGGLRVEFRLVDNDAPADQVVRTTPTAGTEVDAQSTVEVEISRGPFAGTWTNADPRTRSVPQITLEPLSATSMTLHVWGACSPSWCDWGTTTATLAGNEYRAHYDPGFATQDLRLKRSGSQLVVSIHTHFKDNSGRADYDSVNTMNRK